jgi:hypothetical protein
MIRCTLMALSLMFTQTIAAEEQKRTPRPLHAELYLITPKHGEKIRGAVVVRFGLKGMGVAPAGFNAPNTGHHHLLVNVEQPLDFTKPIPADATHIHFGSGQTETVLNLPPGKHRLQLVLADYLHVPHEPPLKSKEITITVLAPKERK